MRPRERHQRILELVTKNGSVDAEALAEELAVSAITVRRDLATLEEDGALRRVYRGATRIKSGSYEPPFPVRSKLQVEAKRQIAAAIRDFVDDGQTVILDAGTTGLAIGEALADRHVTICTPSLRVALALASSPSVRLIMTGGIVRPVEQSLVGSAAIRMLEDHHFDLYIMTASGVHLDHGFSEWNPEDAELKRAALRVASRCIVACDSSKVGHTAFARICDLDAVEMLVTDEGVPEEQRAAFDAKGLKLRIAPVHPREIAGQASQAVEGES